MEVYVNTLDRDFDGISGIWVDLGDYSDWDDFMEACRESFYGTEDCEFTFRDYCRVPNWLVVGGELREDVFDYVNLDEDDRDLLDAYIENVGAPGYNDIDSRLRQAKEAYQGMYTSWAEFAEDLIPGINEIPGFLNGYVDWDRMVDDLRMDYFEVDDYFFRN